MFRVIRAFTVNGTFYDIGDTVQAADEQIIADDSHNRAFVVTVGLADQMPSLPAPNP